MLNPDATSGSAPAAVPGTKPPRRFRWRYLFLGAFAVFILGSGLLVWSFFPGPEVRRLRSVVAEAYPGVSQTKFVGGIGWPALGVVRMVTRFTTLDADAKLGLQALRRADVSVQQLAAQLEPAERPQLMAALDRQMDRQGWERTVTVLERDQTVVIYVRRTADSADELSVALWVLQGTELITVAARCDLAPVMKIIARQRGFPWAAESDRFN